MNAIKENSRGTADLILLLSQVMRYIIRDQRDIVTVREEIDNVQKYFRLISVGYEQRIQLEIDFQQAVLEYPIPKLSIQPLVENAVQHGLGNVNRNGLIRITGKLIDNGLYIYIEDNGQGMKSETDPLHETDRGSIGMANVAKRIRFLFGENSSLTVAQSQLGGVMITICLSYDMKNI